MKKVVLAITIAILGANAAIADECHPKINKDKQNYIVGYGSLINDKSRQRTNPRAKNVYPIEVHNFERVWGLRASESFRGTFLLAVPAKDSSFNAVYYPADYEAVERADERESDYCRYKLSYDDIKPLGLNHLPSGQYWIYAKEADDIKPANKEYPIIQSYVDIFITGCMEIQDRYLVDNYVQQCIETTKLWNKPWTNDRVHPRRPSDSTPGAVKIDKALSRYFDYYYSHPYSS